MSVGVVWFRRDLRLADNPAWLDATARHDRVVGVFVTDPVAVGWADERRQERLHAHLVALDADLGRLGPDGPSPRGGLWCVPGPAPAALVNLVGDLRRPFGAAAEEIVVHVNADASAHSRRRDHQVSTALRPLGVDMATHHGLVVHEPGTIRTAKGTVSRVFTPFYRRWLSTPLPPWPDAADGRDAGAPNGGAPNAGAPEGTSAAITGRGAEIIEPDHRARLTELFRSQRPHGLAPTPDGFTGGSEAAWERLTSWLDRVDDYPETRDRLDQPDGTSGLSSDLKFGVLAPRTVLEVVGRSTPGREAFVRQLAWRDWWFHTLVENPALPTLAVRPEYDEIQWRRGAEAERDFAAWREGRTGYPVVDAAMRELASTGSMHNRARMIAASFLVKHLLIDWRWGERHFRRHLLDSDVAQNAGNWQWVAGTGPDAAPYFRVFNPLTQSRKFDPNGHYLRHWVPELGGLDDTSVHWPADLGPLELAAAGVALGETYPRPIVEHTAGRQRALDAYRQALSSG